jgi:hypothetical protein
LILNLSLLRLVSGNPKNSAKTGDSFTLSNSNCISEKINWKQNGKILCVFGKILSIWEKFNIILERKTLFWETFDFAFS